MKILDQAKGRSWAAYCCDTVEFTAGLPADVIDFSVYSPPFPLLYIFSESERDMANVRDEKEFCEQYKHLVREMYRATRPGRLTVVHCADQARTKTQHGVIGLYDFPSDVRRVHEECGWIYHSRITVWKDPVTEMLRTKALGLLYKQLKIDATRSRQAIPDTLMIFRKVPENESECDKVGQDEKVFPVEQWQQWASPVWMDICQTDVLNVRLAKSEGDEKHVCPLQLDLSERAIRLWSNAGDAIYSPFMGIGSEGVSALKAGRYFFGTELKPEYFKQACKFLEQAEGEQATLFEGAAAPEPLPSQISECHAASLAGMSKSEAMKDISESLSDEAAA